MNGLSKRLVSLTMATAMVFSLSAVPATDAEAASKYSIKQRTSVQATKYYDYAIKGVAKTQYAKVSVSGTAKSGVTVKNGSKVIKSTNKIKGTGKTLTLKVKANSSVVAKKYTLTTKIYNTKTNKKVKTLTVKDVKVNYSATSVKLDQTAVTLKAGETATLKATMSPAKTNSKIKTWATSDANVATVNNGVVTAVAAGTATITVTTSNGKTATATVTVEGEKKPEAFTLTANATKADTITGTLSREVAADATVTVTKAGLTEAVKGTATITGTALEFKGTANFTNGTYTITVKEGELSADASVTVESEYVKEIVITSTQALTGRYNPNAGVEGDTAYVYYDVLNQYGESLRESTNINWTTSAGPLRTTDIDKSSGKLTIKNPTVNTAWTYGQEIYVTGVYQKTGVSVQGSVKVGLKQSLDSVKVAGFVNKNDPDELLTVLPNDFTTDTYVMLYTVFDQDGQVLGANNDYIANSEVSFISDAPLIIDNTFVDGDSAVTVKGATYNAVKIIPGKYADKGGSVNITAIALKTGTKTTQNFVIGSDGRLQSLVLSAPAKIVADGDQGVVIPYVAKDTNGNDIKNYDIIARSSNTLSLSAGAGVLELDENADGTATIKWYDSDDYKTWDDVFANSKENETWNGVDRQIALTTVVVGGESNNMMLSVADKRIPVAISKVPVNYIVSAATQPIDFFANTANSVSYLDQYGEAMNAGAAGDFFDKFEDAKYGTGVNAAYYGVNVDTNAPTSGAIATADVTVKHDTGFAGLETKNVGNTYISDVVKFSIASSTDGTTYSPAGKVYNATFGVVPVEKLNNIKFADVSKMHLNTYLSQYTNTSFIEKDTDNVSVSGNNITVNNNKYVPTTATVENSAKLALKLAGTYKGESVSIPNTYWNAAATNELTVSGNSIGGIVANKLAWNDLYSNSGNYTRKDATKKLVVDLYDTYDKDAKVQTVSLDVKISDEQSKLASVKLKDDDKVTLDDVVRFTALNVAGTFAKNTGAAHEVVVLDQYDMPYNNVTVAYTATDLVENKGEFAHKLNNISMTGNGDNTLAMTGLEIKDAFTLTVKVTDKADTSNILSDSVAVTIGSDWAAYIASGAGGDNDDKTLRGLLDYVRK